MADNLWRAEEAAPFKDDQLGLRAYSSRLLGRDHDLVLHGGGNTSIKLTVPDIYGEPQDLLYVKGSGWDLETMQPAGFSPLRLEQVRRLTDLDTLSDERMMRALRSASIDPDAPAPSVETITHGLLPFTFVDHTHADAVVTISNTPSGLKMIKEIYDDSVLVVPYAMPGFVLAKLIADLTLDADWHKLRALILMNHGVFTFADDARESYDTMIEVVAAAEEHLPELAPPKPYKVEVWGDDLETLTRLRRRASDIAGRPLIAQSDSSPMMVAFSESKDGAELAGRGCLTPDHVIHTKPFPAVLNGDPVEVIERFAESYERYFADHATADVEMLDASPRWVIWPGRGSISLGVSTARAGVVRDIIAHTATASQRAEILETWQPLAPEQLFAVEYWDLEQAKLRRMASPGPFQGKVALVTGAASGIGLACAKQLLAQGAAVAGLDLNPDVRAIASTDSYLGIHVDVTDTTMVTAAIHRTVGSFGGLDIVISNAGMFPATMRVEDLDDTVIQASLDVNLLSHLRVIRAATPFLKHGIDPAVVIIGSKNVPAPGPGAAAYSAAKAGLTQIARVAALEFGRYGIRVNTLHPNAVFDTGVWTDEVLESRARAYGLSTEAYKRNNVLGVEVHSADVAALAIAMASGLFGKTTGAQLPVDGGNERVI